MKTHARGLLVFLVLVSALRAQIYIVGVNTGVTSSFTFTTLPPAPTPPSPANNYLLEVKVDNTTAGFNNANGTVTSFGFDLPAVFLPPPTGTADSAPTIFGPISGFGLHDAGFVATWNVTLDYSINNLVHLNFGAGANPNPQGGNANDGIWFGETATFVFQFYPSSAYTTSPFPLTTIEARWQEVGTGEARSGEGSDFGGIDVPSGGPIVPVPEPATYGLIGAVALAGVVALKRRRSAQASVATS
jgi:hypothetical protein